MYLKHAANGRLVEILSIADLFNPIHSELVGRYHAGEELQDPEKFVKTDLVFPSGEELPQCWVDAHYKDDDAHH